MYIIMAKIFQNIKTRAREGDNEFSKSPYLNTALTVHVLVKKVSSSN